MKRLMYPLLIIAASIVLAVIGDIMDAKDKDDESIDWDCFSLE